MAEPDLLRAAVPRRKYRYVSVARGGRIADKAFAEGRGPICDTGQCERDDAPEENTGSVAVTLFSRLLEHHARPGPLNQPGHRLCLIGMFARAIRHEHLITPPRLPGAVPPVNPPGRGTVRMGRSTDSRRATQARHRRLRTHRVAVPARPAEGTITDVADIPRESSRSVHVYVAGDITSEGA